ncbi:hypothetical protein HPB51_005786 [Rhipicephalus microplus]|uniref:Helicase ATP-binding domain-containing protein n=1 Tax=Rhipicephalus microplus TaxID=6941 RepID=A0A9J6ENB0_RHIMP|nr:hypothetical protein HPB51_005786 [Rhipicephalus microplus]
MTVPANHFFEGYCNVIPTVPSSGLFTSQHSAIKDTPHLFVSSGPEGPSMGMFPKRIFWFLQPILALEESNFPDFIVRGIKAQGEHTSPTCIEAHCWSIALSGGNFLAKAETGSHKALAYVLPAVIHVRQQSPLEERGGPIVVVLAPTPKLAKQVHNVA